MRKVNRSVSLLFFLVAFVSIAIAQNFSATLNKNPVGVGEQFQLTYTLNTNGTGFRPPAFTDISVLSGPNQSSSTQFVNGNVSQSISLTYYLAANREGKIVIPSASIDANGKRVLSNNITLEVVKGNQASKGGNQQQSGDASSQLSKSVFLKSSVSKSNPMVGEAVLVTYKLYTKVSLVNYAMSKLPSLNGFWSQEIELPRQPQFKQEVLDGVAYNTAEIKKVILFPQRSGMLEIDAMSGECIARIQVKRQSNDPFEMFFGMGQQDVKQELKSESIKINVKELPGTTPEGFSGAVGKFNMEAYIDKPETKTNEPVSFKIKISGRGNLKLIEALKPVFPPDIESYDPKISDNIQVNAIGVSGSRTFEYLLVPRHSGQFKIPPFTFSYFDIDKKNYESVTCKEFILKVTKGSETESQTITGVNKEDLQFLGKDIRFIKTKTPEFKNKGETFFGSGVFYTMLFSPVFLFLIFIGAYRKNQKLRGNFVLMKSRKANKVAKKRLSVAKKYLTENAKEKFYDEIFKALWGYASDRLGIPVSGLSKETAREALEKKEIRTELIDKFIETIDRCEFSRFAPNAESEMQAMYDDTINLISKVEEEMK